MLSDAPEGRIDDGASSETDKADVIGHLRRNGTQIEIEAILSEDADKNPIWLISAATIEALPSLLGGNTTSHINKILPAKLIEIRWLGAPIGHWIAAIGLIALSYVAAWFFMLGVVVLGKRIWSRGAYINGTHLLEAVRLPASLYLAVWVFGFSSLWLGLSIIVRQNASQLNVIVAWIAIAMLAWKLIDLFAEAAQQKIGTNGRFYGFSSILYFFRRIIKIVFGIVVAFILLDNVGVDVTAGLAALGIGGIALALGAQKTLENFIGSLAIVIDQPIHIGDFCKIGDVSGTVEDIGMRSTRLRTLERTLVSIPNGDLSNRTIENFARRNRFLVSRRFQLRYDASADKIDEFITRLEQILHASEHVAQEGVPVRYYGPGPDGHQLELFFYVDIPEYNDFLKIQKGIMLEMTRLVESMGLYFIIPSQTMLPAVDQRGAAANVAAAAPKSPPVSSAAAAGE
jgi:MscS family membrane protein